jgi:hypothetical protein
LSPLGTATPTPFHDVPFHRTARIGATVLAESINELDLLDPLELSAIEALSTPRQSVASTHEISGSPSDTWLAAADRAMSAGHAMPATRSAAAIRAASAVRTATTLPARAADVGCAMATAGTAMLPSTAASATSPEKAILCTRLLF